MLAIQIGDVVDGWFEGEQTDDAVVVAISTDALVTGLDPGARAYKLVKVGDPDMWMWVFDEDVEFMLEWQEELDDAEVCRLRGRAS
jgi:hypothetical protein